MTTRTIRVLLAEDDELIRVALSALLDREPDIEVVATAADGRRAVELALTSRPDVAVIDLQMPDLDGLGVVAELSRVVPDCAGVILTGHGSPPVLRRALASGARGFLAKGAAGSALAEAIRRVREGRRYVDPILAAEALTAQPSPLTTREADVLRTARGDRPIREVARALFLTQGTVRNYLAAIRQKLGADSRADAYRIAEDNGWL
ncbi:LuxR family two component transcriptional regulator [Brevibacterium sanguinis]|uniref:LuxR family two component transcriptional regulator n=2 Tax=Brevibacterium TaxID=1696 RepID=A0A366IMI8_9MICO|nr:MULTISPECIES: response regulator transcription factor [Brevibacterium]RBP61726.1 LuxR family two component transcriptional regulator [Brevibacterium sanguinis]RBP74293.1 LuxR family two component transcriptional regulator [Brevibacterium celere]